MSIGFVFCFVLFLPIVWIYFRVVQGEEGERESKAEVLSSNPTDEKWQVWFSDIYLLL